VARAYLFQGHAVLDEEGDPGVEIAHILLEDKVLLGLRRDLGLQVPQHLLRCTASQFSLLLSQRVLHGAPFASSSSMTRSDSLADMDMYKADMEYRFDWRADREPS
jgi:hypothetical protein